MPYLREKLAYADKKIRQKYEKELEVKVEDEENTTNSAIKTESTDIEIKMEGESPEIQPKVPQQPSEKSEQKRKSTNSTKNIVKNYGRAMINFATSRVAFPYLRNKLKEENLHYNSFKKYLENRKENMDGILSLRNLLILCPDEPKISSIKRIFQYSCEVFVKYFSANWIYNSKVGDKLNHLKARFKILRRIKDPEHFTYFCDSIPN